MLHLDVRAAVQHGTGFALPIVEGDEDAIALRALLPAMSDKIGKALKDNLLILEPIGGAGNLSYKLSLFHTLLAIALHFVLPEIFRQPPPNQPMWLCPVHMF